MILTPFAMVAAATVVALPVGYEFDCKSWPGGINAKVRVTLVATDGSVNKGMFELAPAAEPQTAQTLLAIALEQEGWDVRAGNGFTVIAFAPKGQSIKSVKFDADVWVPQYKRIVRLPPLQKEPKK